MMWFGSFIAMPYRKALVRMIRPTWTLCVLGSVPSDQQRFLQEEAYKLKWLLKFFKRWLIFTLLGQRRFEKSKVPPTVKRILWINLSAPSLGDALMDLSARRLLADRDLHLLSSPQNAPLFATDDYFSQVLLTAKEARFEHLRQPYDLIILDSFCPRSLLRKIRVSWSCPLVGMYGFVNGFEVHRTLYSFCRLRHLMSLPEHHVTPRVPSIGLGRIPFGQSPRSTQDATLLAIGVGGEWAFRTYAQWGGVLGRLRLKASNLNFVLLGSSNGLKDAALIENQMPDCQVLNLVGKTSLQELCAVLRQCDAYLGADGGLWHIASACGLPSVALFADCQLFDEEGRRISRASPDQRCVSLLSEDDVNQIRPEDVVSAVLCILRLNRKA